MSSNEELEQKHGSPSLLAHLVLVCLATTFLSLGFVNNTFDVAEESWFKNHQKDTEGHVFGNLVRSSEHGLWEHSGFNGYTQRVEPSWKLERPWGSSTAKDHIRMYLNEEEGYAHYNPYFSQPGGQAWIFVALDQYLNGTPKEKLEIFRWLTGITSALALSLILSWLLRTVGWGGAICAGLSMLYSPWLTVFGANLWWFMSSFFFPMIIVAIASTRPSLTPWKWFFLSAFGLFVKSLLTGFEYISTTLVMSQIPLICELVRKNSNVQTALSIMISSCCGAIFGTVLVLGVLCVQVANVRGDLSAGIDHIVHSFNKRSSGAHEELSRNYNRVLETDVEKLVKQYRKGICYDLDSKALRERSSSNNDGFMRPFRFDDLISALKYLTLLWFFWSLCSKTRRWFLISFLLATWASILAPLSWFIVFKGHSAIHFHMNYICWHMPFSFMVAAMLGVTLSSSLQLIIFPFRIFKKKQKAIQVQEDHQERKESVL